MKRDQAESGTEPLDPETDVVAALRAMERRFYVALLVSYGLLFVALKLFP